MNLEQLNYAAVHNPKFTSFKSLMPGRFRIEKFFFSKDEKYSSGAQRLCALIDNGLRYLMLPKRMMTTGDEGKPVDLADLNKAKYDIVYEGKANEYELKFHFVLADEAVTPDEVILTAA